MSHAAKFSVFFFSQPEPEARFGLRRLPWGVEWKATQELGTHMLRVFMAAPAMDPIPTVELLILEPNNPARG